MKSGRRLQLVLAGTPEFAARIFTPLIQDHDVLLIITRPDAPSGRHLHYHPSPVKLLAIEHNIEYVQPTRIAEIYQRLAAMEFDYLITAAYGEIIPPDILALPRHLPINVHASLLPYYRGAAPIQRAILAGESRIGITLIIMTPQMDAGNMLQRCEIDISNMNTTQATLALADTGSRLISEWLAQLAAGLITPIAQDSSRVTYAPKLLKAECEVTVTQTREEAIRRILACGRNPGAYYYLNNIRIKLYQAGMQQMPGGLTIELSDGILYVYEYQYPGKRVVLLDNLRQKS